MSITSLGLARGANILVSVLMPITSSHPGTASRITGALVRHGHNVTVLVSATVGTKGFEPGTFSKAVHYRFDGFRCSGGRAGGH